jgi:hypothetical protein
MSKVIGIFTAELERSEDKEKSAENKPLAASRRKDLAIVVP